MGKVEIRKTIRVKGSLKLAEACEVSHGHLLKVIKGERKGSAKLYAKLNAAGVKCMRLRAGAR